ncbi:MAG: hypothetical protein UT15_C0003G0035 [Berkelbacteria bacterium GW2011_GWA1_39_10]|uniref:DUF362 domain-containing protein n=1 Tax=Berkelbacteria bacterium GW2011_GWA1_39_10 TaxID=1618332 RepID=A0A0G0LSA8_9BACT|nr:MAG: hypothetical protein UT15_C0003G0035 [Berkelbacteria bacterium GW2011_GWA1_39_10]
MSKVALTSEENRYETVFKAIDYFKNDIQEKISRIDRDDHHKNYILIKPNCVVTDNPLAATHPDAILAVLDFLQPLWNGRIILAEGSGIGSTMEAFKNYGYLKLKTDYPNLEFSDLNYSNAIFIDIFNNNLQNQRIKISNTVHECPLRISVSPPKTHNSVIVTLSIKNMAIGSILTEDKEHLSHMPKSLNRSIAAINEYTFSHFAVIDGWQGMEGKGPDYGKKVDCRFAVASTDTLAADIIATQIMGFNPLEIGYLNFSGAQKIINNIDVLGRKPTDFQFHFKPHPTYKKQLEWM